MEPQQGQLPYPSAPMAPPVPAYSQPPRRKRRVWLIVLLVLAVPLLGVAVLVVLGVGYNALSKERPATADEQKLVLTTSDMAPFLRNYQPDPQKEKAVRTDNIDGSWEVHDEYSDGRLFLSSFYFHEDTYSDAENAFTGQEVGTKIGYAKAGGGIDEAEHNEFFKWGDESHFYVLSKNGKKIGNRFVARKGKLVVVVMFSGVYFAKAGPTHDLLDPLIARIDAAG